MPGLPISAPYDTLDEITNDLMIFFQDDNIAPSQAYMACLLMAGKLSAPSTKPWTDAMGEKFIREVNDLLGAYWQQGFPS
jgi:hypothetical protein